MALFLRSVGARLGLGVRRSLSSRFDTECEESRLDAESDTDAAARMHHSQPTEFPLRHRHGRVAWHPNEPAAARQLPLDLFFVRHGESEGNLAQRASKKGDETLWRTAGFPERYTSNYRLTSLGRLQAERAGHWLRQHVPDFLAGSDAGADSERLVRYYCSEYIRAQETAAHLGLPNARWIVAFALREREKGIGYGMSNAERHQKVHSGEAVNVTWHDLYRHKDSEPFYWAPSGGGGESIAQVCQRFETFLATAFLHGALPKTTIIVAHGNLMRAARVVLEHMTQAMFKEWQSSTDPMADIDNGQIFHYSRVNPHHPNEAPRSYFKWMRSILPASQHEEKMTSTWHEIHWPMFSNAALLEHCSHVPQLVDRPLNPSS